MKQYRKGEKREARMKEEIKKGRSPRPPKWSCRAQLLQGNNMHIQSQHRKMQLENLSEDYRIGIQCISRPKTTIFHNSVFSEDQTP